MTPGDVRTSTWCGESMETARWQACAETVAHASLGDGSQEPGIASSNLHVWFVWPLVSQENFLVRRVTKLRKEILGKEEVS